MVSLLINAEQQHRLLSASHPARCRHLGERSAQRHWWCHPGDVAFGRRQSGVGQSSEEGPSDNQRQDLSIAEKYTDALWRVVPIPSALGVALVAVWANPSGLAMVALVLTAIVGLLVEVIVWRELRDRWAAGSAPNAVGDSGDDSWTPAKWAVSAIVLVAAWTWKGHCTQGMSWGEAALFSLILLPVYIGLIAIIAAIANAVGHGD